MKKVVSLVMAALLCMSALAGCSSTEGTSSTGGSSTTGGSSAAQTEGTGMSGAITVISREEGSGTRGAFVELMGVETDDGDMTTENAEIANSTSLVQNTVSGNKNSIGYISLGSYDSSAVKAVKVDGVEATVENIKAGKYAVSRPFVLCYKEENLTDLGKDFIKFILSAEGQAIVSEEGYITVNDEAESYTASGLTGNLSLNGSTSVGPVMEVLAEAYMGLNSGVTIDIQQTGSGTGITATIDGSCEIGMSSREIKDEELSQGLTAENIALDGIAVIVNQENTVEDLTSEQIRQIYTGEVTDWSEIG